MSLIFVLFFLIQVSKLHINPFYKKDPFDTNVAILELSEQVEPNGKIKPACLWQQAPNNSPSILEAVGIVSRQNNIFSYKTWSPICFLFLCLIEERINGLKWGKNLKRNQFLD